MWNAIQSKCVHINILCWLHLRRLSFLSSKQLAKKQQRSGRARHFIKYKIVTWGKSLNYLLSAISDILHEANSCSSQLQLRRRDTWIENTKSCFSGRDEKMDEFLCGFLRDWTWHVDMIKISTTFSSLLFLAAAKMIWFSADKKCDGEAKAQKFLTLMRYIALTL